MNYKLKYFVLIFAMIGLLLGSICVDLIDGILRNLSYVRLLQGDVLGFSAMIEKQLGKSTPALHSMIKASVLHRDFVEANTILRQNKSSIDARMALWLFDQAVFMLGVDDIDDAVGVLDLALLYGQFDAALWYQLGGIYRDADAPTRALEAYERGIESDTDKELPLGWCHMGTTLYSINEWQRFVDLFDPFLYGVSDAALNRSKCRTAVVYLADSYAQLGQRDDSEKTYHALISLNPNAHDWQMYNALSNLGDIAYSTDNISHAMDHYSQAYDVALKVPTHVRAEYEEDAWNRLERLAEKIIEEPRTDEWISILRQKNDASPDSLGLNLLWGLICEKKCDLSCAEFAHTRTQNMATDSITIARRLDNLTVNKCNLDEP
jgi:tetratricopeptide (TPR) repeat protein